MTLGCARNEGDSEELAARLEAGGWRLTDGEADVVIVNTCGFIQAAKQESIDELLAAAGSGAAVVAAGCLAERYGAALAQELPEAQVLSFDDYPGIAERLRDVAAGRRWPAHQPRDRRGLLPIAPADRPSAAVGQVPGHGVVRPRAAAAGGLDPAPPGPARATVTTAAPEPAAAGAPAPAAGPGWLRESPVLRRRLGDGVVAPLKIASGCDRRCSFCAIPAFRGAFVSRPPADLLAEARWLAGQGVRELLLVSENSTSYGKDLGDVRLLESLLPDLAAVPGIRRVRVSYLQPAELRPGLIEVIASAPGVAAYFDLSFQHASGTVLRAMRRFGDASRFLDLIGQIRERAPAAGIRSNFIVGFPGETRADFDALARFLEAARLDAIGIFGYSDEDGTAASGLPGHLPEEEIARRVEELAGLADELMDQRAAERVGEAQDVLIEERLPAPRGRGWRYGGRAEHQAPEVDGATLVRSDRPLAIGEIVRVRVTGSEGVDLRAGPADGHENGRPGPPGGLG